MINAEVISRIRPLVAETGVRTLKWSRKLWQMLSLSLADDRIAAKRCLSVELASGGISVVYASRFLSRLTIRGVKHYPFATGRYPTPENLASNVMLALNDLAAAGAEISLIIPKAWVIIKTADFPLAVKDNLSSVISYELDRLTPFLADRAFYDFQIITENEGRLQLMLAAVNSDIIQPYLTALQEKNLSVNRITVSTSALGTLSQYLRPEQSTIFAEMSGGDYEGGLISKGKWRTSFAGNFSSSDEHKRIALLAEEINPLVDMMKKEGGRPEVIVDQNQPAKWPSDLRGIIRAKVRFINELDLKLRFLNNADLKSIPYKALGGALEYLWPHAAGVNLLAKGNHKPLKTPVALTIVLLCILAALGLFRMAMPLQIEEWKMETIDREIAARKDEVRKAEVLQQEADKLAKDISTINTFKTSRPQVVNLLKEMTRLLPRNTWLSRVRIAESIIEIEGYAATATEILPKLEASEYFKKVDFASPTFRDTQMNADRFTIKMEIKGLPEEKKENAGKR